MEKHLVPSENGYVDYSSVVDGGHILPYKAKYTMRDFRRLVEDGWDQLDARFIILCSWAYYYGIKRGSTKYSKTFDSDKFLLACEFGIAK